MEERNITCICCPLGCAITVEIENSIPIKVTGNTCKRGGEYAKKEVISPTRMVTSTVRVRGGKTPVVAVKTKSPIPKGKIGICMKELKQIEVEAPVNMGQIILKNVAGTGVDIVATNTVEKQL